MRRLGAFMILATFHGAAFVYVLGRSIAAADAHQSLPTWFPVLTIALALPVVAMVGAVLSIVLTSIPRAESFILAASEGTVAMVWAYFVARLLRWCLPDKPVQAQPEDGAADRRR